MRSGIAWVQINRPLVFTFRSSEIIIKLKECQTQRRVRFSKSLIERLRFKSKSTRLRYCIRRRHEVEASQENVRVSQTCIRESVVGIERNSLIETINRRLKVFLFAFAPIEPSLQVQ